MHPTRPGLAIAALLALAACAERVPGPLGADFGNAVEHNAAQHVVDPHPAGAQAGPPALDGVRAGAAIRRYETGAVIPPERVETTTFGQIP